MLYLWETVLKNKALSLCRDGLWRKGRKTAFSKLVILLQKWLVEIKKKKTNHKKQTFLLSKNPTEFLSLLS